MQPRRFLERLRAEEIPGETHRVEQRLAVARVLLAISALTAVYIDPTEPSRYARVAYSLFILYTVQSLAILALLQFREDSSRWFRLVVHAADIVWPTLLTLFTEGPNSPFFVIFLFVLLAAAYRWGFRETLATASFAVLLQFLEALLITSGPGAGEQFVEGQFEVNRLIIRATYILLMGALLGYLAEEEKLLRAETAAIARIVGNVRAATGLRDTLEAVMGEILRLFDATQSLLVTQETGGGLFLWNARFASSHPGIVLHYSEGDASRHATYFFPYPAHNWQMVKKRGPNAGEGHDVLMLGADGRRLRQTGGPLPDSFLAAHPFQSLMVVSFEIGAEWSGRLFVFAARRLRLSTHELRFLQLLVRQASPSVYSAYLLRRLRTRAGAMERARVARELHDGAIQSLTSVEMQVGVLRQEAEVTRNPMAEELGRIQELLRREVLDLRELMEHLKPVEVDPRQLLDFLADTVEKFRRETGIAASFVSELDEVMLQPRVCREVVRIVQEALMNVRKHARAANVVVRIAASDGAWQLVVDDDGRGFPFAGRFDQAQLDLARKGPMVIKERVRSFGGELAVESTPGHGARLEITIPRTLGL